MHAHLVWTGEVVSVSVPPRPDLRVHSQSSVVNGTDVANQQGDVSWIGSKTQTLLWRGLDAHSPEGDSTKYKVEPTA